MSNAYIVESGNWKMRVVVNEECGPHSYVEAATRAIEGVFGHRTLDVDCEIVSLYDNKGRDFFDPDCDLDETPPRMFSVVTVVRREKDKDDGSAHVLLTSVLFANASQPHNYELALKAEALEPDKIKQFKDMCEKQHTVNETPPVKKITNTKKRKKKS